MIHFRWLWVGTPEFGWALIGEIWHRYFANNESVELWVKALDKNHFGIEHHGNVTFDFRRLESVSSVFRISHACILPRSGMWQIPVREAVSIGIPCVILKGTVIEGYDHFKIPAWEIRGGKIKETDAIRSMIDIIKSHEKLAAPEAADSIIHFLERARP